MGWAEESKGQAVTAFPFILPEIIDALGGVLSRQVVQDGPMRIEYVRGEQTSGMFICRDKDNHQVFVPRSTIIGLLHVAMGGDPEKLKRKAPEKPEEKEWQI